VARDLDGSGTFDNTTSDVTVANADGSKTETVIDRNADGSLRDQTTTLRGADGRSRNVQAATNGDGIIDHPETIAIAADGSSVETVSDLNANGSLTVVEKNTSGGEITTTLTTKNGGVGVEAEASNVQLGGYLERQAVGGNAHGGNAPPAGGQQAAAQPAAATSSEPLSGLPQLGGLQPQTFTPYQPYQPYQPFSSAQSLQTDTPPIDQLIGA